MIVLLLLCYAVCENEGKIVNWNAISVKRQKNRKFNIKEKNYGVLFSIQMTSMTSTDKTVK